MTNKILFYKLSMPIIPCMIHITVGHAMLERAAKHKGLLEDRFVRGMLADEGTEAAAILLLDDLNILMMLPEEWDEIAVWHESLHCATRMWYDVGAELKVPRNDEVLTYTQGYIASYIKEVCYDN